MEIEEKGMNVVKIVAVSAILFVAGLILSSCVAMITQPQNMLDIAAEHLHEKYGLDREKMKLIDYSLRNERSFMGSGWVNYTWILVNLSDGTRVRVLERPIKDTVRDWETVGYIWADDYQLMDECLLGAEYFSALFGLDITFVEYYNSHETIRNKQLQTPISDLYYRHFFSSKELSGYMTKENIGDYLHGFMNLDGSGMNLVAYQPGIVMYIRIDFEKDDADSIFANVHATFLASPLADTNAELILCFHDVDLDIRLYDALNGATNELGNYFVGRKGIGKEDTQHFPLRRLFLHQHLEQYKAYALRLHGTNQIGDMAEMEKYLPWP